MINWLILLSFAVVAAVLLYRWRQFLRRRSERRQWRHITRAEQWWGKR